MVPSRAPKHRTHAHAHAPARAKTCSRAHKSAHASTHACARARADTHACSVSPPSLLCQRPWMRSDADCHEPQHAGSSHWRPTSRRGGDKGPLNKGPATVPGQRNPQTRHRPGVSDLAGAAAGSPPRRQARSEPGGRLVGAKVRQRALPCDSLRASGRADGGTAGRAPHLGSRRSSSAQLTYCASRGPRRGAASDNHPAAELQS